MKLAKRRYLALKIEGDETFDSATLMNSVWGSVTKLFGEYGASQAALVLIDYDETEKLAIIRTWHRTLEMVRTALATITKVNGKNAAFRVIMVSGTLKTLRRKIRSIPFS